MSIVRQLMEIEGAGAHPQGGGTIALSDELRHCRLSLAPNATLPHTVLDRYALLGRAAAQRNDMVTLYELATAVAECYNGTDWTMGHTAQVPEEVAAIRTVLGTRERSGWRTICEAGFNAGHSAIMWLQMTDANLVEFDAAMLPYHQGSRSFLEAVYPQRISFHIGNSRVTYFDHAAVVARGEHATCDLSFIDALHIGRGPHRDLRNALTASNDGAEAGWLFADDCTNRFPEVRKAFAGLARDGSVQSNYTRSWVRMPFPAGLKGWCYGKVNAAAVRKARERHRRGEATSRSP